MRENKMLISRLFPPNSDENSWRQLVRQSHTGNQDLEEVSNIDPDDGNSWLCHACRLPIFSTPFTTVDRDHNLVLHDQCANLPAKLEGHPLHPVTDLILHQQTPSVNNENIYCSRCHSMCGSAFYKCSFGNICGIQFDLPCALAIRLLHRSHKHKLTAVMGSSSSFICAACGTQHRPPHFIRHNYSTPWELSYVCSLCDFWIHPDCAVLPNAIVITKHHPHTLLLTYFDPSDEIGKCAICDQCDEFHGLGMYACFHCRYSVHIKCAVYSDSHSFKRVFIRDAQVPGLLRLPMPNEDTSVMFHMTKTVVTNVDGASTSSSSGRHGDHTAITSTDEHQVDGSKTLLFENDNVHEHPLIFHDHRQDGLLPVVDRVCDACIQLISPSDPFYSCSNNTNNEKCTNFFLHSCCAHLPDTTFTQHPAHNIRDHPLSLLSNVDTNNPFNLFYNDECCRRRCNGFAYACKECDFYLDIVCALMPVSITHDAHGKSHILHITNYSNMKSCNCCKTYLWPPGIFYECNTCRNFGLHAKCALFPDTVRHRFDRHPLKLITTTRVDRQLVTDRQDMFCEICEKELDDTRWYYGCKECDQSFHIDCIPSLDRLSKIKFGFKVRVPSHDCPVVAVRALSVDGYRCDHCGAIIRESNNIAFECSECYYRIHEECAEKLLGVQYKLMRRRMTRWDVGI